MSAGSRLALALAILAVLVWSIGLVRPRPTEVLAYRIGGEGFNPTKLRVRMSCFIPKVGDQMTNFRTGKVLFPADGTTAEEVRTGDLNLCEKKIIPSRIAIHEV